MYRLDDKVALVTGASRGIGRATAKALAARGARVFVNYRDNEEAASQVVADIEAAGGHATIVRFDVADSKAVDAAVSDVAKSCGRLDIVVANAGVARDGLLMRAKDDDLQQMMDVNVRGALALARAAVKPMLRARRGRIVFISSVIGEMGNVGQASYAASKAALLGMMRSLARELGSRGITVNAVTPGLIDTDMTSPIDDEMRAKIVAQIPLGRFGSPEDVASAVAYLCSDEAGYVTGHALRVNGGMYV
ncbi:MAG: 3-oxoacyl-[acyl-carrier-protein] reductase [Myxococcota bacterium]